MIEWDKSDRGFTYGSFFDKNGHKCSIQSSSIASEAAIWLGTTDPKVTIYRKGSGWSNVTLPTDGELHITGRMHLSQEAVQELLPFLQYFARTGELEAPSALEQLASQAPI